METTGESRTILYRVFHNNRPKIMAYCSKVKSPGDFLRLMGAYQMWSIQ